MPSIIATPFRVSFSVAKGVGAFLPFQSKLEAIMASVKSALGSQSVQLRCPWKPPAMAFLPISSSLGLPYKISRMIMVILVMNAQSLSGSTTLDLRMISGRSLPALQSKPSLQLALTQLSALSNSS